MRKRETLSILHRMSYMLCACQGCSRSWKVLWIYALLAVDCWMPKRIPISHNIHYHKLLSADAAETPPSSASPERGRQAVSVMSVTGSFICSTVPGLFRLRPVTLKPTARRPGTQTLSTCRCPEGLGHWQLSNSKFKHPMSKHSKQDKQRLKAATISRDLSRKRVVSQKHEYCRKSRETELHGPATHAVLCGGIERCCSRRTLEDTFRLHPWGDTVLNGHRVRSMGYVHDKMWAEWVCKILDFRVLWFMHLTILLVTCTAEVQKPMFGCGNACVILLSMMCAENDWKILKMQEVRTGVEGSTCERR